MKGSDMHATFHPQRSTLRAALERAAGMHPAPIAGTTVQLFGACDAEAHGRCPGCRTVGQSVYTCSCDCHLDPDLDPADWDARYGEPWWATERESE